jgi:hypothetical protein
MRNIYIILLFFIYHTAVAQDSVALVKTVGNLNSALQQKDTAVLKKLLHKKLSYGHSNGWIESRQEVMTDLHNGKLVYNSISQTAPNIVIEGKTAAVRAEADIDVALDGKQVKLRLHILQVWIWKDKDKEWKLLSRQSTKI